MKKYLTVFMLMLFAVVASACQPKHGLTIAEEDKDLTLEVGDVVVVTPTLKLSEDTLTWSSSDEDVVTVSNGSIEAVGAGTAIITVVIDGTSISATIDVTVSYVVVTSVNIAGSGNVVAGATLVLTGSVAPANANPALTWASSNIAVASVSATGVVTGVAVGSAQITATAAGTTISDTVTVTVIAPDPTGITVTGAEVIDVGTTSTYTATVAPTLASQEVTWSVDHPEFATINATTGALTGVAGGSVVVTATSVAKDTVAGTKTITINHPAPTSITITGDAEAQIGVATTYTAIVAPIHALQTVIWSVSDEAKATINATTGALTGVAVGTVEVRATSTVLGTIIGTKQVTIIQAQPTGVTVTGNGFLLLGTPTATYTAAIAPLAAEQGVTWSVNNTAIATIDAATGILTPVSAGTVIVTATSTAVGTVKGTLTVVVYTSLSLVVDDGYSALSLGAKITLGTKDFYYGYTAFASTADLTGKLVDGVTVELKDGTYSGNLTIDKNDVTLTGAGTITGVITVNSGVSGLTIDGLTFTGTGQVIMAATGGVSNFTFINNHVYDTKASMSMIYFPNNGTAENSNFVIENNVFEIISAASISSRYIRGGNITNLKIVNNSFEGIIGQYTDGIRLEGTDSGTTAGIGIAGELIIRDNTFDSLGQRSIWIRRYSATLVDITGNSFNKSGDQSYGGGVQIEVWVPGQTTSIVLKRNVLKDIGGSFAFRINNTTLTATDTWSVVAHYNAFFDMYPTAPFDDFIQAYSDAAKGLINADYNLFFQGGVSIVPAADRIPFVGSCANQFTTLEALAEAILFDQINESGDSLRLVGTHTNITKQTYATLAEAYAAAVAGDTILLLPGTYATDITIAKNDLTITSLNGQMDPTDVSDSRQVEAIFTAKMTLGKALKNFTISGIKFTGNAQIVNTLGDVGTASATTKNLEGFTFANNIVETGLASGKGFIYFVEAASCYSHDLVFVNNTFKTTANPTTLSAVVYIDNDYDLTIVGNVFKDITGDAFYIYDTTKGMSGVTFVEGNTFENITGNGFWANWLSPLPGQIGKVRIVNNTFKNVGVNGVYIGKMNNTDTYSEISVLYNTFDTVGNGAYFFRVHTNSNTHFNYNKFLTIPVTAYVTDGKDPSTSSPVTLDATKNLYMNAGAVITPDAGKFLGTPNYAEAYTTEEALPVYLGEGEIMMATLAIDAIIGKIYVADKYQLTYTFTPELATATDVTWDTSDITVATVSATGELTALKAGTVTITVTSVDNPTLKATIEITIYVFETIELRHADNGVIEVGDTTTLSATTYPSSITDPITYTSKTPAVATVSATGVVTGVAEGTVVIEAAIGARIVSTITLVVKNEPVTQIDPIQFLIDANVGNALMRNIQTFGNTTKTELLYGAVTKLWFGNLSIIEALAPVGNSRPGTALTSLEFIVVHDTGNNNLGANGLMHKNYLNNNDPGVSWHYVVDDEGAYHQVPNTEVAYHAGDGSRPFGLTDTGVVATTPKPVITISVDGYYELNGTKSTVLAPKSDTNAILTTAHITDSGIYTNIGENNHYYINNTYYNTTYKKIANQGGNRHSIGIESCVDQGSDIYATWQNLAKLVASLLDENGLSLDRVLQHNNMSGKNCPQTMRTANLWSYFMEMVTYEYKLRTTYKDYTFSFVSNNPTIVNNSGKIINKPKVTTEVSYTITVTGPSAYNQSITLYATIPGTKILG